MSVGAPTPAECQVAELIGSKAKLVCSTLFTRILGLPSRRAKHTGIIQLEVSEKQKKEILAIPFTFNLKLTLS